MLERDPLAQAEAVLSSCYQAAVEGRELLGARAGQPTVRLVGLPPERMPDGQLRYTMKKPWSDGTMDS